MIKNNLFEPILNVVLETMPRDNLLNSACLEFFEFIRRVRIAVTWLWMKANSVCRRILNP